jgi:4-amino-4-deoxy-L-arabinose transferase-like glycosyltransferase
MWLKLPGLLVEVLSAVLVYRVAARKGPRAGARAFAAYGVSLVSIIGAGYHGNTDPVYAGLTLLSAYALEAWEAPFWAGVALALALNVKLMPIFLVPPLLARCRSRRAAGLFLAGLALGVVPFLPFLLTIPRIMYTNMVAYNSLKDEWGLGAFFNYGAWGGAVKPIARAVAAFYIPIGRYVILLGVLIVAVAAHLRQRWNAYELGALGWASFLIFTPGFGVQYTVCIVPLLFAADVGRALLYSTFTGVFLLVIYTLSMPWALPLWANIRDPYAPVAVLFGLIGWAGLVVFVKQTFVYRLIGYAPAPND